MNARISSLVDDELEGKEATALIKSLKTDRELRQEWETYHLIGDVMRDHPVLSPGFSEKLSLRLSQEPVVLAPVPASPPLLHRSSPPNRAWIAFSAAASVAAVGLAVWAALQMPGSAPPQQMALRPLQDAVLPVASVKEYLFAHQEFSPSTDIQGVTPYMRTVSETRRDDFR